RTCKSSTGGRFPRRTGTTFIAIRRCEDGWSNGGRPIQTVDGHAAGGTELRILYQHRTLGDGAEGIHIIEIVRALERLGHEVLLHGLPVGEVRPNGRSSAVSRVRDLLPASAFELAQLATSGGTYMPLRRTVESFRPHFIYKRHAKYDFGTVLAARRS